MKLFLISPSIGPGRYVWGFGFYNSAYTEKTCRRCQRPKYTLTNALIQIKVEGKGEYPDNLGFAFPYNIVSERVLNLLVNECKSLEVYLRNQTTGEDKDGYYLIETTPCIAYDYESMGVERFVCKKCGAVTYSKPTYLFGEVKYHFIKPENDLPLIFCAQDFPRVLLCTEEFLHLAIKEKLTNFYFAPIEEKFKYGCTRLNAKDTLRLCKKE